MCFFLRRCVVFDAEYTDFFLHFHIGRQELLDFDLQLVQSILSMNAHLTISVYIDNATQQAIDGQQAFGKIYEIRHTGKQIG